MKLFKCISAPRKKKNYWFEIQMISRTDWRVEWREKAKNL